MMLYDVIQKGTFISRPNRFIAEVAVNGKTEICHVKNTGRCKELLLPGATVFLNYAAKPSRTTAYDLVAVEKGPRLINMDSQAPNRAFGAFIRAGGFLDGVTLVRAEAKYGASRFDFYVETADTKAFVEVKGVTLEEKGTAYFPDAPTERGVKHLKELSMCVSEGYDAYIVFVVQMQDIRCVKPNDSTHAAFGETLREAVRLGVKARAYGCQVTPADMFIDTAIPIQL